MKRLSGPRTIANVSESLHRQFGMYAIAAGAAMMLLTMARPVEAKIVYTKANVRIGNYNLDLNNDGTADVALQFKNGRYVCQTCRDAHKSVFYESPASGNGVLGNPPTALKAGAPIGPNQSFYQGVGTLSYWYSGSGCGCQKSQGGPWYEVTDRYLGVAFQIQGKTHYGWARMSTTRISAALTGYAYETIPNKAIIAGKTHGNADDPGVDLDTMSPNASGPAASLTSPAPGRPPTTPGQLRYTTPGGQDDTFTPCATLRKDL